MRNASWFRGAALCGVIALLAPYSVALVQEARSIADILTGKSLPLAMKPADMPDDYKPVRLKVAGAGGGGLMDMMSAIMSPFTMLMSAGSSGGPDADSALLMTVSDVNWTKGDVVKVQGKDFIVTYKWNIDIGQMSAQSKGTDANQAKADAIKNMELSLSLIAVDGLTSISPVTGFTKADLVKLIQKPYVPSNESAPADVPVEATEATEATDEAMASDPEDKTLSNAKQIATGLHIYISDYDDVFPYAQSTKAVQYVTYPYVKNVDIWKTFNPNGSQLLFNMALGGSNATSVPEPHETVMFYESKPWPDGRRVVAFADSHTKFVSEDEWRHLQATLKIKLPKSAKPLPMNYGMDWTIGK